MKVAVIGSRGLNVNIEKFIPQGVSKIISGGARGIDTLAEQYADSHGIPKLILKPDYKRYGRGAPHVRNRSIVEESDLIIAIWDGKSRGTKETIDYAMALGKEVQLYKFAKGHTVNHICISKFIQLD